MKNNTIFISLVLLGLFAPKSNAALVEEEDEKEQADFKIFNSTVGSEKNTPLLEIIQFISHYTSQGGRLYQEDDHIIDALPDGNAVCAVFDGRCGLRAKEIAKDSLRKLIRSTAATHFSLDSADGGKNLPQYIEKLLKNIFIQVESTITKARKINFTKRFSHLQSKEFGSIGEQLQRELEGDERFAKFARTKKEFWLPQDCSSSCVLLLLFSEGYMWVASLGNCKGIMRSGNHIKVISKDHSADNQEEAKRVVQNEGWFIEDGCFRMKQKSFFNPRCSRAFGASLFTNNVIDCTPDITCHLLTKDDDFIILGTDGFWDGITEKEACDLTQSLKSMKFPLYEITPKLSALSYAYNKTKKADNSTVMVIDVQKIYNKYQQQFMAKLYDSSASTPKVSKKKKPEVHFSLP